MKLAKKVILMFLISLLISIVIFIFGVMPFAKSIFLTEIESTYEDQLMHVDFYLSKFIKDINQEIQYIIKNSKICEINPQEMKSNINELKKVEGVIEFFKTYTDSRKEITDIFAGCEDDHFISNNTVFSKEILEKNLYKSDFKNKVWYKNIKENTYRLNITDIYSVKKDNNTNYFMTISSAIKDKKEKFYGVIGLNIDVIEFAKYFRKISLNKRGSFGVMQSNSVIFIDRKGEVNLYEKELGEKWRTAIFDSEIKKSEKINNIKNKVKIINGEKYFISSKQITGGRWVIFYFIPMKLFNAELTRLLIPFMISELLLAILFFYIIIFGVKILVVNPIKKITYLTSEIANTGDLSKEINIFEKNEIGILAMSFNKMILELKNHRENLESIVNERTKEIIKYSKALEQSPTIIVLTDLDGNIEYVNPKFIELTGYSKEEVLGKNPRLLKSNLTPEKTYVELWKTVLAGNDWRGEFCNKKKNGELFWENASISAVRDEKGKMINILAVKEDISDKKRMEEELKKTLERIEILYDASLTLQGSNKLEEVFEIILDKLNQVVSFDTASIQELTEDNFRILFAKGFTNMESIIGMEFPLTEGNLSYEVYRTKKTVIIGNVDEREDFLYKSSNESIKSWMGVPLIFNDEVIGELTLDSTKYNFYTTEMGQLVSAFATQAAIVIRNAKNLEQLKLAKEEAEAATRAKGDFLANMSHEIRTPLNAIIGFNSLLEYTKLSSKQKDYILKVGTAAKNLLGIINDILDFSKIEAGKLLVENIGFDLEEVLDNISNVLSFKAYEKGIEFIISKDKNVPNYLIGDPLRLGQILLNIVNNAIKFTEKGEILIKIELKEMLNDLDDKVKLLFEIKDTGIGMNKNQLDKLFTAFTQADNSTTRKYGGTGLGLSISKNLLEIMNGEIGVESEEGKGSNFYFTIEFQINKSENIKNILIIPRNLKNIEILLIESNNTARKVIENYLMEFDYKVTSFSSGDEAINEIKESRRHYDLILIDWKLETIEVWKEIRSLLKKEKLPKIILMTAYAREEFNKLVSEEKINGIVTKPIAKFQLINMIMNVFEERGKENNIAKIEIYPEGFDEVRGAKILIVEDNEINQEIVKETLEREGFWVDIVENGRLAVNTILRKEKEYDIILMDLQMPVLDGYKAAKELREKHKLTEIPIIALSADAMSGIKEKVIKVGINDYVSKPIEKDRLFEALMKWIKPGKRERNAYNLDIQESIDKERVEKVDGVKKKFSNTKKNISSKELLKKFSILKQFIESYDTQALDVYKDIEKYSLDNKLKNEYLKMGAAVNEYQFEYALESCEKILSELDKLN